MAPQVVYFTRSGYTKKVAETVAARLESEPVEITDGRNWKGFFGFIRGGYYSSRDLPVEITVHGTVAPGQPLVVVTPLWAGKPAPAVRTFLKDHPRNLVHLVVTSNGVPLRDRTGYLSVTDIVRARKDEAKVLGEFYLKYLS